MWAPSYALSSVRNHRVRSLGIALILAIGVALPTTVFVWSHTGARLSVDEYFSQNIYQMALYPKPDESFGTSGMESAVEQLESHPLVERLHRVRYTLGILTGGSIPTWDAYSPFGMNYANGIKDMSVIFVTNDLLSYWKQAFEYIGNFSMTQGEILVSGQFVEYARDVHNLTIEVGNSIDIDIMRYGKDLHSRRTPEQIQPYAAENLTVAGIYNITDRRSMISSSIMEIQRKNWDPFGFTEPVFGIRDSVLLLDEQVSDDFLKDIAGKGYFSPLVFVRASSNGLLKAGTAEVTENLLGMKNQFEEEYPGIRINGLREISILESNIETYMQSRILTVVVFPVLIMSLILTVFASEDSVSRRKGEISALRSKGASFNQIFATFIWESILLTLFGFLVGVATSILMAPLISSSTSLFVFDPEKYSHFFQNLHIPPISLIIGGAIALYLPAAYLFHVARRVDVTEIGQSTGGFEEEETDQELRGWYYAAILGITLIGLVVVPTYLKPVGTSALSGILLATVLLFFMAYVGSKAMRLVTAKLSERSGFLLGEKRLYLTQSLRRRKGRFIPLLVILTLTITTTTMVLIQASSFQTTVNNELDYSIGADLRVECDPKPLSYNETLLNCSGVTKSTPILQLRAKVAETDVFLEGVNPMQYLEIGHFRPETFLSKTANAVMTDLSKTTNGIVISSYYASIWNKSVGDDISIDIITENETIWSSFKITGIMKSAPSLGFAAPNQNSQPSFGAQFGFQVGLGGFALVNIDYLSSLSQVETSELFLADATPDADLKSIVDTLSKEKNTRVYSLSTFDLEAESYPIWLFLSGIQGLTAITSILCAAMGISAITLFLGSAVSDRKEEYAIFRALGGTRRQVVEMVFGEFSGSVLAAILVSLLLGFVFGFVMTILTFGISPFLPTLGAILSYPIVIMTIVLSLECGSMIAACYLPAKQAGSVNPAQVLRNL